MTTRTDFAAVVRAIGPQLAQRGAASDSDDSFVADNYSDLKAHGLFRAGVPAEFGGGDAGLAELAAMLREMAHYCSSTALALSMHTHQVAIPAWRWHNEGAPTEALLRRIVAEDLVLVSSGGSDWLESSGSMQKVDGGFRMTGRKVFASGSPAGDILMTSAPYANGEGEVVLHFPLSLRAEGVRVLDNWRTLGMRGTGSNDVFIEGAFIPDAAIGMRRPKGEWGIFHHVVMIALPLVYSVYVGIAERARELALQSASKKRDDVDVQLLAGEMETELRAAQIALDSAIAIATASKPGPDVTNEVLIRRTLIGNGVLRVVEKAMELAGGASYFRSAGLERLFRDVQAARFHPMTQKRQSLHTGKLALGIDAYHS
jgi:alkylation response protein AidB-like acyl-CoA dehydrogenase